VAGVVDRFYEVVLADPQLAGFFTDVNMPRLKRHQTLLISQVLGGPAEYDGADLDRAHAGLGISSSDFNRVVTHLVAVLNEAGVDEAIIERVGAALGGAKQDIVSAGAV
jgi:hemoglobin